MGFAVEVWVQAQLGDYGKPPSSISQMADQGVPFQNPEFQEEAWRFLVKNMHFWALIQGQGREQLGHLHFN